MKVDLPVAGRGNVICTKYTDSWKLNILTFIQVDLSQGCCIRLQGCVTFVQARKLKMKLTDATGGGSNNTQNTRLTGLWDRQGLKSPNEQSPETQMSRKHHETQVKTQVKLIRLEKTIKAGRKHNNGRKKSYRHEESVELQVLHIVLFHDCMTVIVFRSCAYNKPETEWSCACV